MYRKRNGFKKSLTKYEGGHREKIITSGDLLQSSGMPYYGHSLIVSWETNNNLSSNRYSAYRSTTQWVQCSAMYKEYRVKGFKLELFPQTQVAGSGNINAILSTEIYSDPCNNGGVTPGYPSTDQAMRYLDYKMYGSH